MLYAISITTRGGEPFDRSRLAPLGAVKFTIAGRGRTHVFVVESALAFDEMTETMRGEVGTDDAGVADWKIHTDQHAAVIN